MAVILFFVDIVVDLEKDIVVDFKKSCIYYIKIKVVLPHRSEKHTQTVQKLSLPSKKNVV